MWGIFNKNSRLLTKKLHFQYGDYLLLWQRHAVSFAPCIGHPWWQFSIVYNSTCYNFSQLFHVLDFWISCVRVQNELFIFLMENKIFLLQYPLLGLSLYFLYCKYIVNSKVPLLENLKSFQGEEKRKHIKSVFCQKKLSILIK